jgi:hypothetical protein
MHRIRVARSRLCPCPHWMLRSVRLWLWLFIPGGILMITSPCLLGTDSSRASGEQEDGHKLYGHE